MRKLLLLLFGLFLSLNMMAQLEVKEGSFKEVEGFVNLNPDNDYQFDDNDKPFAVIKINTENINDKQRRELKFEGSTGTFFMLEYQTGEVWVYLTAKYADYIKISHPDFGSTEFTFPLDLKAKKGYEMVLVNKSVDEDFQKRLQDIETLIATGQSSIGNDGYLVINTTPEDGATVFIDGEAMELKTPFVSDKLDAGKHRVRVTKDLYKPYVAVIDITKGETTELNVELKPNYAELKVVTADKAEIWLDGEKKGASTWSGYVSLEKHTVEAKKEGYRTQTKTIKLDLNDSKTLTFNTMEMITGDLEIITTPRRANVKINNEDKGRTPQTLNGLKIGDYKVEINKRKYQPVAKNVTVKDGEKTSINVQLERYKSLRDKGWVIRPEIGIGFIDDCEATRHDIITLFHDFGTNVSDFDSYINLKPYNGNDFFTIGSSFGYQINPYVYCGLSVAACLNDGASIMSMPVCFNPRFYLNNRKTSIYFDIKLGWSVNVKPSNNEKASFKNIYRQKYYYNGEQIIVASSYTDYITIKSYKSGLSGFTGAIELGLEFKHSSIGLSFNMHSCLLEAVVQNKYYYFGDSDYHSVDEVPTNFNNETFEHSNTEKQYSIALKYGYNIFLKKKNT